MTKEKKKQIVNGIIGYENVCKLFSEKCIY